MLLVESVAETIFRPLSIVVIMSDFNAHLTMYLLLRTDELKLQAGNVETIIASMTLTRVLR